MARIALIGENSVEYIQHLINIWNCGDCAVLIDKNIPQATAIEMMKEANVEKCFLDNKVASKWSNLCEHSMFFVYETDLGEDRYLPGYIYDCFQNNYTQDEAIVIYSSGTTGKSKGIILSHYAINVNADAISEYMRPTDSDSLYIAKPFTHSSTLTGELLLALKFRIKAVIAPTTVPARYILDKVSKYGVSILCVNPTLLNMLSEEYLLFKDRYDISALRVVYVSGSILNDIIYDKSHKAFKGVSIFNIYGLSEAAPRVTAQRAECCKTNSVGTPILGVKVAVVDDDGKLANNGVYGIVHIKTPSLFNGYITGCEKNKSLYKEWYNTGDLGYFDVYGELHIVGRIDDVIIIDSHKIYPCDIEDTIQKNCNVDECCIVPFVFNDEKILGCLYVGDANHKDIKKILSKLLLHYEIPRLFVKRDILPKTNNGKIAKNEIKQILKGYVDGSETYE